MSAAVPAPPPASSRSGAPLAVARDALALIRDRVRAARGGEHLGDLLGELEAIARDALEATAAAS